MANRAIFRHLIGLVLVIATAFGVPRKSEAALLAASVWAGYVASGNSPSAGYYYFFPATATFGVGCFFFLPACILDEKSTSDGRASTIAELREIGYSDEDSEAIRAGQLRLRQILGEQEKTLVVEKGDDARSITAQVLEVYPEADPRFVKFLIDAKGLK